MEADGATEEYAEAMNEAIDAANTAEEALALAVRERDLARQERDHERDLAQAELIVCHDCFKVIIRDSEQHDQCRLLNNGEDLVCERCAVQRLDGDFFGDDDDDDAEDAAENIAGVDAAERLHANGCLDLMVITVFVLFILCWCFSSTGAYDLLVLTLVLIATIFWCVGRC